MPRFAALAATHWLSVLAKPHHSKIQDREIEALSKQWIEDMKSLPEPYQSWAIEKIKDARIKNWNSIGEFYVKLLSIAQQVIGKSESELGFSKREITSGIEDSMRK